MDDRFSKDKIIRSERYRENQDVLNVLLDESMEYSIDEVDEVLKEFNEKVFTREEE